MMTKEETIEVRKKLILDLNAFQVAFPEFELFGENCSAKELGFMAMGALSALSYVTQLGNLENFANLTAALEKRERAPSSSPAVAEAATAVESEPAESESIELSLASTPQLLRELTGRFDSAVFGAQKVRTEERTRLCLVYTGDFITALGLAQACANRIYDDSVDMLEELDDAGL